MNDKLNGRKIYIPRGRDSREDLNLLADAIASSSADLFNDQDEQIIWVAAGRRVAIGPDDLRKICAACVVTKQLVNQEDVFEVAYVPHEPDEMTLRNLMMAKSLEDGGLIWRLPKLPLVLSDYQRREVRARLERGERADHVGRGFGVDAATIRELAR